MIPILRRWTYREDTFGDYTQVCVHSIILAGVGVQGRQLFDQHEVCFINEALPDYCVWRLETPIKVVRDLRKYVVMGKGKPYPWMHRFERGMPWQGIGYEARASQQAAQSANDHSSSCDHAVTK